MAYFEPNTLVSDRRIPFLSLVAVFFMVLGGIFIGDWLATQLLPLIFGAELINLDDMDTMANIHEYPEARSPLLLKQGISALFGFIILPLIYLFFIEKKRLSTLSPNRQLISLGLFLTLAATFLFMVINARIAEWNMEWDLSGWLGPVGEMMEDIEVLLKGVTEFLTTFESTGQFILGMLVIAVVPAVGEELVFRGCIQNQLLALTKNGHVAIWLAGFLFSAIHFQFFGFIPRLLLGVLFGYLYYWSGHLIVPILAHFFNNGLQIFLLYAYQREDITYNIDQMEDSVPWWLVAVCSLFLVGVMYLFKTKVDQSSQLPNSGKWQSVFHSDQNDRIEKVRLILADKGLHPVIIDSKHGNVDGPIRKEVHVAPIHMAKARKIIEQDITFE